MKIAVVCGASGLIGSNMCLLLRREGYYVRALSRTRPLDWEHYANEWWLCDLRQNQAPHFAGADECYNFACEVGGIGFISNHNNDSDILRNSTQIDIQVLEACRHENVGKLFFASSACIYPSLDRPLHETDAYPAGDNLNAFAWQKLFAERLYAAYAENHGMTIHIGRFFNTYGVGMEWREPRAKSVAALCRKVAELKSDDLEIWGDGTQRRSYTYVEDACYGAYYLMQSDTRCRPVNIGYEASVSVLELVEIIGAIAHKSFWPKFVPGPVGMPMIEADCSLLHSKTGWRALTSPHIGLRETYPWVEKQVLDNTKAA